MLYFAEPVVSENNQKRILEQIELLKSTNELVSGTKACAKSIVNTEQGDTVIFVCNADVSPADLVSHFPELCRLNNVPYIFVNNDDLMGYTCVYLKIEDVEKYEKIREECKINKL